MTTAVLDFHNYLRLEILLSTYGNFVVRKIFRSRYMQLTGNEWEDCSNAAKEFLAFIQNTLKKTQKIQKQCLEKGDINEWDLGTTFLVLRTMCSYKKSYVAQSESDTDATKINTENKLIAKLIEVRNSIMHSPGKSICLSDFKIWWGIAAEALLSVGVSSEDIENVRTSKDLHGIEFKNLNDEAMNAENVETAKKLREEGNIATNAGQFLIAILLYTKGLRLYGLPKIERAILCSNRSYVYLKSLMEVRDTPFPKDELDSISHLALKDAERAIELRPTWFKGYLRQARVYEFKKEWEPATKSFDQALGLHMGDDEILKARDVCRMELTRGQWRDYLNPTEILDRTNSQEYIDKMCSDRGTSRFCAKEVCKYYEKLLKSKDPREKSDALVFLADRYAHGLDGYQQNYETAIKLCKDAEDLGDPAAMSMLGSMHQLGHGVPIDLDAAVKLYEKSVQVCLEKNYANIPQMDDVGEQHVLGNAQCLLGRCYLEGLGKPIDYYKAAKLYSLASDTSRSREAAYNLGWLYLNGQGVIQNNERATQYWKLAARRGAARSLRNLAWTNLTSNNLDAAELHFSFALKASPILTSLQKKKFYDTLNSRRAWKNAKNKMASPNDHQNQDKNPLVHHKGSTKRNDDSATSAKLRAFDDEFHSYGVIDTELVHKTKWLNAIKEMEEKAALGLPYATIVLTSFQNLHEGQLRLDFLESISKDLHPYFDSISNACSISKTKTEIIGYLADHYRTLWLAKSLSDSSESTLKEITTETMKLWNNKESDIDCNARICYSSIIYNSSQETVNFLTVCQRKYPQEIFFPIFHSSILGFELENKEKEALDVVIEALNKFPGDVELLCLKAKLLHETFSCAKPGRREDKQLAIKDIVTAFKAFVNVAPPDHRRVPSAYYTLGLLHHADAEVNQIFNTESLRELEKYLGLGLEAEKNLLSLFVLQYGNSKNILQTTIHKLRSQLLSEDLADLSVSPQNSRSNANPKERETQLETFVSGLSYIQQTDPNRVDSVLIHRNAVKTYQNFIANAKNGLLPGLQGKSESKIKSRFKNKKPTQLFSQGFTVQSLHTQELPSKLAGLKEIHLEEIDPLTDHVYTGRVLQNATIVEDSLFDVFPSIMSVLMDSNGEFQRCAFINLDHSDDQVRKHLSFGSRLSIINPYYRLSVTGGCGLRIEDPESVVFRSAGDEEPLCRFCLAKNPQHHCSKCKRANYCSKECEMLDSKILQHRLICKP